ncbi:hypothetical protein [Janthinobacterium lividum]|uniref:hypothetical protein n=1 Tax=Janthinobacterium lividum TaxID=29581 RepID=UPI00140BB07F|nr:hypothetical protein [Janthinobacterium lividum]NHQ93290.1 hypothetical protein [Janthinobacterium lividum]
MNIYTEYPKSKTTESRISKLFDPNKSFLQLPIVWIFISIFLIISLVCAAIIILETDLPFQPDANGFNHAANQFRVPLAISTLSIPFLALIAATHRSEQTKRQMALTQEQIERSDRQIKVASQQNLFSNHFKNLEEFIKNCNHHENGSSYKINSPRKFYTTAYPNSKDGDFETDNKFYHEFNDIAVEFLNIGSGFKYEEKNLETIANINKLRSRSLSKLNIRYTENKSGSSLPINEHEQIIITNSNLRDYIITFIDYFNFIDRILSYDTKYETPPFVDFIINIDTRQIPAETISRLTFRPFALERKKDPAE